MSGDFLKWLDRIPKAAQSVTAKTDTTPGDIPFVSFGGESVAHIRRENGAHSATLEPAALLAMLPSEQPPGLLCLNAVTASGYPYALTWDRAAWPPTLADLEAQVAEVLAYVADSEARTFELYGRAPSPVVGWRIEAGPRVLAQVPPPKPRPDLAALAAQPGHCGSCARFEPDPTLLYLGTCHAPLEDWWPTPPLAVHPAHKCDARAGKAYKAAP